MINFPHDFSKFITANRPVSLIIGAGASHGLVPLPWQLIQDKKDGVEKELARKYDCKSVSVDITNDDALYEWAEKILKQLVKKEPHKAKLILAQELGLTTDEKWVAKVGIELRGTTARHRVMARFAKEGLWRSIWSLNWDTILESALERVGLERGTGPKTQPWPTLYSTTLINDDFADNSPEHIITVNKPHGCVHGLIEADNKFKSGDVALAQEYSERLIIGKTELSDIRNNKHDDLFLSEFKTDLGIAPLTVIGWSASEKSLHRAFESVVTPRKNSAELEELTIIDPTFNEKGHQELIECYELTKKQVHFKVDTDENGYTVDKLFLWIQARYVFQQLSDRSPAEWNINVDSQLARLDGGECPKLLIDFADYFLPTWVRLCWRTGILECNDFQPEMLQIDLSDEHIPINKKIETVRHELKAAAGLLTILIDDRAEWDLAGLQGELQGGLWDEGTGHLVIPLPAWEDPTLFNDLRALAPLMRGMQHTKGYIQKVSILPLCASPAGTVSDEYVIQLKNKVASMFDVAKFSDPSAWGCIETSMCKPREAA